MGETVIELTVTAPDQSKKVYSTLVKRPFLGTVNFQKGSENAEGTMAPVTFYEGEIITLPGQGFSYEGRNFLGWAQAGESLVQWQDGDEFTGSTADQTLVANWGLDQNSTVYVSTFGSDSNEGSSASPVLALEKGLQMAAAKGPGTRVHVAFGSYTGPTLTLPDGVYFGFPE